ncbi:patched domain-containing protein 3-like [Centruroides sculpturatus]|uniref:patched domain-containing protein 3-like n=1 Tax=Centruroides sculpturatus TaxID=218467 RepID=UPI000C6CB9D6|nr:patched domain-containing protein 3-like [Centruroides sculpturatus]
MNLMCIQNGLSRQFQRLGRLIGGHPLYFIAGSLLLSIALSSGILNIQISRNADYLFTSTDGKAVNIKRLTDELFPVNTSFYMDIPRITNRNFILFQIVAKEGETMLREDIFNEINIFHESIKNISININGKVLKYKDLCAKKFEECEEGNFVKLLPFTKEIISGKKKIKYPVEIDKFTFAFKEYILTLGGVELDEEDYITDLKSVRQFYILDFSDSKKLEAIKQWQQQVYNFMKYYHSDVICLSYISHQVIDEEIKGFTNRLLPRIPFVVLIIAVFSFITLITNDWVKSKPWLGPSACLSAGIAITSGFGLMSYIGIEYVDFNIALCYSVLATEIDDSYILISAWRRTNPKVSVADRMAETFSEAVVSVTITSLTNFLSFSIGIASNFPAIRIFCIYAATCTLFTYVYQITFFGGCMALSGYREKKRLHSITFQFSGDENPVYKEDFIMAQLRDKLGPILTYPLTKVFVFALFFINVGTSLWGLAFIKTGNEYADLLSYNSTLVTFSDIMFKYFGKYTYPIHLIINKPLNYADNDVQRAIEETIKKFESHPHISESALTLSWLKYYKSFMNHPAGTFLLRGYNMSDKQDFIDGLRNVFLKFPQARQFELDIKFNENYTDIIASRFLLPMKNIDSPTIETNVMKEMEIITENTPVPVKVFSLNFHFLEQAILIKGIAIEIGLVASALICIIFFLFVPNITCAVCISVIIICIIIETVGIMVFWNVKLDLPSLTILILCVGFSINYPTHISSSFVLAGNLNSKDRIKKSLYEVGFPIFQGSCSTILGVMILGFQPFYISRVFFKIISIVAIQTAFHALFLIPLLLDVLGQCDKSLSSRVKTINDGHFAPLSIEEVENEEHLKESDVEFMEVKLSLNHDM